MSKEVSLNDFYNNADGEEEDEDSEQDSDFVLGENESDADDYKDLEEEEAVEEEEQMSTNSNNKKRSLPESIEEDATAKKSRIDAIWADMNDTASTKKSNETSAVVTEEAAPATTSSSTTSATTTPTETAEKKPMAAAKKKMSPLKQKRPKSSLSSLVSQYNIKEPKMNTLEKSKLDWQGYVDREGIRDDLKYKNKDGYMEKVAFLQRVDDRRLSQLKSGQKKKDPANN